MTDPGVGEARSPVGTPQEGDLPTNHLNRCKLRDDLFYRETNGEFVPTWRCHKRAGHEGPCSCHNDCGVQNEGRVVCGLPPGHSGPHAWETIIRATDADVTCEHGTAMDVHCCNCHSGFIFDRNHECPPKSEAVEAIPSIPQLQNTDAARSAARFVALIAERQRHTEAVAECPHCTLGFLAQWVLDVLGPEAERSRPPGPPDPPRANEAAKQAAARAAKAIEGSSLRVPPRRQTEPEPCDLCEMGAGLDRPPSKQGRTMYRLCASCYGTLRAALPKA